MFHILKGMQKKIKKFSKALKKNIWQNVYKVKGERRNSEDGKYNSFFDTASKMEKISGGDDTYGCIKMDLES